MISMGDEESPIAVELRGKEWWDVFGNIPKLENQHFGFELLRGTSDPGRLVTHRYGSIRVPLTIEKSGYSSVSSTNDMFEIELSIEHYQPENINVEVNDKYLVVSCMHEEEKEGQGTVERKFTRSYVLPKKCDTTSIKATINAAKTVLAIKVPKEAEYVASRTIKETVMDG